MGIEVERDEAGASEFEDSYADHREIRGEIFSRTLGSVPRRAALTVPVTQSVRDTIAAMNEHRVGCALVTDGGRLVGIFTERDVLVRVAGVSIDLASTPVEAVMTPAPDTLPAHASIAFALVKMTSEGYRHIPLVGADGAPVGVVAVRDIVAWIVELLPDTVLNLPPDTRLPTTIDGG